MSLKEWAENEIRLACNKERASTGKNYEEWDYGCACYNSALKAFNSLMEDGHSGMSISITKTILNRLIDGKPLTAIEDTDDVWSDTYDISGLRGEKINYQCKRMSSLFKYVYNNGDIKYSDNDRVICVNNDAPNATFHWGKATDIIDELYPITMPYLPANSPFKVFIEDYLYDEKNGDYDTVGIISTIKPDGEKVMINKYFKEENRKLVEIDESEYLDRVANSIRKDNPNE